jgi:hypothetical protein
MIDFLVADLFSYSLCSRIGVPAEFPPHAFVFQMFQSYANHDEGEHEEKCGYENRSLCKEIKRYAPSPGK